MDSNNNYDDEYWGMDKESYEDYILMKINESMEEQNKLTYEQQIRGLVPSWTTNTEKFMKWVNASLDESIPFEMLQDEKKLDLFLKK